ncbi:HAD-IB family hydrolase [Streptomyces paromomycinus]|uniref:Transferase n=1 Tax=Streptomyces paromomycinus TaxID=92743 RepID=A0A401VV83_STREY|nr:HAD-IB family hydrolase [Streptomyces paromomycinus]GCD40990.1 transferase [Streptomyces paromomycinus]
MSPPPDSAPWRTHRPGSVLEDLLADVAASPDGPRTAAYFDLDGTLLQGHSALAFCANRLRHGEWPAEVWHGLTTVSPHRMIRGLLQALSGTEEPLATSMSAAASAYWHGRRTAELAALGERVFQEETASLLSRPAWTLVRAHQARGHTVAIATAASRAQALPVAETLGIGHLICTEVPAADGRVHASPPPPLCIGPRKLARVRQHARRKDIRLDQSFAYCDGTDDLPLLESVGHPRVVDPRAALRAEAFRRGWPVVRSGSGTRASLAPLVSTAAGSAAAVAATALMTVLTDGPAEPGLRQSATAAVGLGCDLVLRAAGVRVAVTGEEHLWSHRPAVFVANHTSPMDAVLTGHLLRDGWFPLAKKELAGTPVIGRFLAATGAVFVDRDRPGQSAAALATALGRLRRGLSLAAGPEGTRARTPDLGPFRPGLFVVARKAGVPVVPIVIHNATDVMARDGRLLRPGTVRVTVLPPVDTSDWHRTDIDRHTERIRDLFLTTLGMPR